LNSTIDGSGNGLRSNEPIRLRLRRGTAKCSWRHSRRLGRLSSRESDRETEALDALVALIESHPGDAE